MRAEARGLQAPPREGLLGAFMIMGQNGPHLEEQTAHRSWSGRGMGGERFSRGGKALEVGGCRLTDDLTAPPAPAQRLRPRAGASPHRARAAKAVPVMVFRGLPPVICGKAVHKLVDNLR